MGVKTQGTQLYMLLPTEQDPAVLEVVELECTTAITLGGSPKDQLDDTCLSETDERSYLQGLGTPAAATVNLNADPKNASHLLLYELLQAGTVVQFALGWSDAKNVAPTFAGGAMVLPQSRTWNVFKGYVSDFPFDFQGNAVVATTASVQRSGASRWVPKTT